MSWDSSLYIGGDGIITGCDENHEWMLKWWWENYSKHNTYPVTILDFGMSRSARLWCENRFPIHSVEPPPLKPKEATPHSLQKIWEELYGPTLWKTRPGWSRKPFAFLKTPYDRTLWLDIDCQVLKPLNSLFTDSPLAITYEVERAVKKYRDHNLLLPGEKTYNTGVVSFLRTCPLIPEWAQRTLTDNHLFLGDQDILSRIIHEKNYPVKLLPDIYNRRPQDGCTPDTHILHFVCNGGKHYLLKTLKP